MTRYTDGLTCIGIPNILRAEIIQNDAVEPWKPGLIYGPSGVGKSYLAAMMARSLRMDHKGYTWINASRYVDDCRWAATANLREYEDGDAWREIKELEEIPEADYLIIDDIGIDKPSDFTLEKLYNLVDIRWSNGAPTVVTSNLSPSQLAERIGDRIVSRIVGFGKPRQMVGVDRRVPA